MTTRTVIHDGRHDAEISDLAERHGTTAVRTLEGSWWLFCSDGSTHVLPSGRALRVTRVSRRVARFEVVAAQRVQVRWDRAWGWWVGSLIGGDPERVVALAEQAEVPA